MLIELRDIAFAYEGRELVHQGLSFGLAPGERVGIIGANGAGKTTMFHLMVGLLQPLQGQVLFDGRTCRTERDFWPVREQVGLLFQDPDDQLFCPTVAEDVAFGPLNLGRSRPEVEQIVGDTLALLDIAHLAQRVTHHLSGGEKRLVSLAAVLAMGPRALLLDEPTSGLAEAAIERLLQIMDEHVETCAIISHNRGFLDRCTDTIVELGDGRAVRL